MGRECHRRRAVGQKGSSRMKGRQWDKRGQRDRWQAAGQEAKVSEEEVSGTGRGQRDRWGSGTNGAVSQEGAMGQVGGRGTCGMQCHRRGSGTGVGSITEGGSRTEGEHRERWEAAGKVRGSVRGEG